MESSTSHHLPVVVCSIVDDGVGNPRSRGDILDAVDDPLSDMQITLARIVRRPRRNTFTRQDALGILTGERDEQSDYLPALRSSR
jgi:hypothetical protein